MSDTTYPVETDNIPLEDARNFLAYEYFPEAPRLDDVEIDRLNNKFSADKGLLLNATARSVGVIATRRKLAVPYVAAEAATARGTVVKLRDELAHEGLVDIEKKAQPSSRAGGRPAKIFVPTLRLYSYIRENQEWGRAAKLSTVAQKYSMTQLQFVDSIVHQALDRLIKK